MFHIIIKARHDIVYDASCAWINNVEHAVLFSAFVPRVLHYSASFIQYASDQPMDKAAILDNWDCTVP